MNIEFLIKMRDSKKDELRNLLDNAEKEERVLNDSEDEQYNKLTSELEKIERDIKTRIEFRDKKLEGGKTEKVEGTKEKEKEESKTQEEINSEEIREILTEQRNQMNTTTNEQGGIVVNKHLSHDIIKEIKDRSGVYSFFNSTSVKGNFKIPKKASSGTANWVAEGEVANLGDAANTSIPTLEMIELEQHRLYRESAITKHMINVQELDLVSFIKEDIVESMTDAIENAILLGTGKTANQPTGILKNIKVANQVKVTTKDQITVAQLKRTKAKIKKAVVNQAKWFMHPNVFLLVDLLEDGNGRPLIQPDPSLATGYRLLGLEVVPSDAMPDLGGNADDVLVMIACPAAYHTNTQSSVAMHVYTDSAYTRHGLVGYGADIFMDGKPKDDQLVAGLLNIG